MTWRMCGLLGAALAAALLSCGPSDAEAMKLKEGQDLNDTSECPFLQCSALDRFCGELLFDYGRSPPLCLPINICERLDCLESGRTCTLFEGAPAQVRCVED